MPLANMANPCSGSDVAERPFLATLSAAVVQCPLLALKMSTALLTASAHAQRISIHPQQLKAPPSKQHMPHTLPHHTVLQYQKFKTKQNSYCLGQSCRLRIWPILAEAVTSLQENILPR
jgi:hypothetical protein